MGFYITSSCHSERDASSYPCCASTTDHNSDDIFRRLPCSSTAFQPSVYFLNSTKVPCQETLRLVEFPESAADQCHYEIGRSHCYKVVTTHAIFRIVMKPPVISRGLLYCLLIYFKGLAKSGCCVCYQPERFRLPQLDTRCISPTEPTSQVLTFLSPPPKIHLRCGLPAQQTIHLT